MTDENEMSEALDEAFRAALLLTGSIEAAETAVSDGIAALEFDDTNSPVLLMETVKSAIQFDVRSRYQRERAISTVPFELGRVIMLPAEPRRSFVMRILLGMPARICSELLDVPVSDVENALCTAVKELPLVLGGPAPRNLDPSLAWSKHI